MDEPEKPIHMNSGGLPRCMRHTYKSAPYADATFLIGFLQTVAEAMAYNKSAPPDNYYAGLSLVLDLLADKVDVMAGELRWPLVERNDGQFPTLMELLEAGQDALQAKGWTRNQDMPNR